MARSTCESESLLAPTDIPVVSVECFEDGTVDRIWYLAYIDTQGLDAAGRPKNAWTKTMDVKVDVDDVPVDKADSLVNITAKFTTHDPAKDSTSPLGTAIPYQVGFFYCPA